MKEFITNLINPSPLKKRKVEDNIADDKTENAVELPAEMWAHILSFPATHYRAIFGT
ncbi:MAG: hypothetical protein HYX61_00410 [Gammaproteobacteria bacterium]|jgi:hypothetical protein|nr:hypothetical protein [Gammaproteobacteria bacterium]